MHITILLVLLKFDGINCLKICSSFFEVEQFHEGGECCQRARRGLDGFDLCPHFESAMRVCAIVKEGAKGFRWKCIDELLPDELAEVCVLDGGDAEVSDAGEL